MRTFVAFTAALAGLILALPVMLAALPFLLVATATRALARLLEPSYLNRDQLIQFDAEFGWKARPNLDTHHLMGDLFHIRTDAQGWRGRASIETSDIIVFGDSFAAGYGVGERHFFANLSRAPRIKPIGIGGYSMVQEFLWMKRLARVLRGKLVVWFIYFGNDLYDNLVPDLRGYRKPFVRETRPGGNWEIYNSHVSPQPWPIVPKIRLEGGHHLPRLADLCGPTYLAERAYRACEFLIREGERLCEDAGAELVVLTIPDAWQLSPEGQRRLLAVGGNPAKFDATYPDSQVEAICRRLGVGFLAGSSFLDAACYRTTDCHWNEKGHRRVAAALASLLPQTKTREVPAAPRQALSPT